MKKILAILALPLILAAVGCGKPTDEKPTPTATLESVQQEAFLAGVTITQGPLVEDWGPRSGYFDHIDHTHSNGLKSRQLVISWGGVGKTESEMLAAIQILRKFYVLASAETTFSQYNYFVCSTDKAKKLAAIDDAVERIQMLRNEIITKKICETNK